MPSLVGSEMCIRDSSEILIEPANGFSSDLDVSNIDDYNPHVKEVEAED